MEGGEAAYYGDMARRLVKALSDRCAVRSHEESNGLLLHGTYARASAGNPCANRGVDECNTWGDYFYMEGAYKTCGGLGAVLVLIEYVIEYIIEYPVK